MKRQHGLAHSESHTPVSTSLSSHGRENSREAGQWAAYSAALAAHEAQSLAARHGLIAESLVWAGHANSLRFPRETVPEKNAGAIKKDTPLDEDNKEDTPLVEDNPERYRVRFLIWCADVCF